MPKRKLLDSSVPEKGASASKVCGICDRSPAFLCPTCPRRRPGEKDTFDHGWAFAFRNDPEMAEIKLRDAQLARAISITHDSHSAMPDLIHEYQKNGDRLMALYDRRRQERLRKGSPP